MVRKVRLLVRIIRVIGIIGCVYQGYLTSRWSRGPIRHWRFHETSSYAEPVSWIGMYRGYSFCRVIPVIIQGSFLSLQKKHWHTRVSRRIIDTSQERHIQMYIYGYLDDLLLNLHETLITNQSMVSVLAGTCS